MNICILSTDESIRRLEKSGMPLYNINVIITCKEFSTLDLSEILYGLRVSLSKETIDGGVFIRDKFENEWWIPHECYAILTDWSFDKNDPFDAISYNESINL